MPGALVTLLEPYFNPVVRGRGRAYFRSGDVAVKARGRHQIVARVRGSHSYSVSIAVEADRVTLECDCPFVVQAGEPCKHLWAVTLAADAVGALQDPALAKLPVILRGFEDAVEPVVEPPPAPAAGFARRPQPSWRSVSTQVELPPLPSDEAELVYFFDPDVVRVAYQLHLTVHLRRRGGERLEALRIGHLSRHWFPDPTDRWVLHLMRQTLQLGVQPVLEVAPTILADLLPRLARTGRLHRASGGEVVPLEWDPGEPWRFTLELCDELILRGKLERGDESRPVSDSVLCHAAGLVVWPRMLAPLDTSTGFKWISALARSPGLAIPQNEVTDFVRAVTAGSLSPPLRLPARLGFEELRVAPRPVIEIGAPASATRTHLQVLFDYDGVRVQAAMPGPLGFDGQRRLAHRDRTREAEWLEGLGVLAVRDAPHRASIATRDLSRAVESWLDAGWEVWAEEQLVRRASGVKLSVRSGVDWFGIDGSAGFDGGSEPLPLPALLAAVRKKQRFVQLGDGSVGLLPDEWIARWGTAALLAAAAPSPEAELRIPRVQLGLLSVLTEGAGELTIDPAIERLRGSLAGFSGIAPLEPPRGFRGELRAYQKLGLGWLRFLEEHGFGACLADDMGLGKTVQVLALLALRRGAAGAGRKAQRKPRPPALVVVPKSLIDNWRREAERFTPGLRVHVHHGAERAAPEQGFRGADLVLTTYGTLRRDIEVIRTLELDSVVLDEAQSIKNAASEAAKAVRLLSAPHRVALSGTPIENHMGELWSLFEFLNPGLFSANAALAATFGKKSGASAQLLALPGGEAREVVRRAVRPFILRRTKAEVAPELPARTEQTVLIDLEPAERRAYDELQAFYRDALGARPRAAAAERPRKTKQVADDRLTHVLTALLRLRQAACHPGLLDDARKGARSAKLGHLIDQLREIVDEGHKALVFSQFTSLLALVRPALGAAGIEHEYLDGATRDRLACVDRFQAEGGPPVFVMSLKAGGVGLNLTAADYVFLLDPWWNPASEAQAIDRAHRIGQGRPVVAYRLIARNTVEERVAELQDKKRELVSAVLGEGGAGGGLGRGLTREDLEALLE